MTDNPTAARREVAQALIDVAANAVPGPLNPYLEEHLAAHVATGRVWDKLADHPQVLDRLDPAAVAAAVLRTTFGRARLPAQVAGVAGEAHTLAHLPIADRGIVREMAALRFDGGVARPGVAGEGAWQLRWAEMEHQQLHFVLNGHRGAVTGVAAVILPGREAPTLVSAAHDGTIRFWDPLTAQQIGDPLHGHDSAIVALDASTAEDGTPLLVTASIDGTARRWNPAARQQIGADLTFERPMLLRPIHLFNLSGRPPLLAIIESRTVRLHDVRTGQPLGRWDTGHGAGITAMAATAERGRDILLATASIDKTVRIWRWSGIGQPRPVRRRARPVRLHHPSWVSSAVFAPGIGQDVLLLTTTGWTIQRWSPSDWTRAGETRAGYVGDLSLTALPAPDGTTVVVGHGGLGAQVYSPGGYSPTGPLLGERDVEAVCSVPLDRGTRTLLATAGADHTVRLWNLSPPSAARSDRDPYSNPRISSTSVFPLADGRTGMAVAHSAESVRIVDLDNGELAAPYLKTRADRLAAVPTPRRGRSLLAADGIRGNDHFVTVWDPQTGDPVSTLTPTVPSTPTAMVGLAAPDGTGVLITSCSGDGGILRQWDAESGTPRSTPLAGHDGGYCHDLAILNMPGTPVLISAGHDHTARLWAPLDGVAGPVLSGHANVVTSVIGLNLPDGRALVATASSDGTVRLWDPLNGAQVGEPLETWCRSPRVAEIRTADAAESYLVVAGDSLLELWAPEPATPLNRIPCFVANSVFTIRTDGPRIVIAGLRGLAVLELC
ncbi:WD40 repeat domain-containing protein [Micromonospora sp. LOL_021]|uniref:WD40 repeat domain-containing protein n=1 Tax=Micromonospora sp. LOL_021 TaxID=3345417 RepID=UPI003A8AE4D0